MKFLCLTLWLGGVCTDDDDDDDDANDDDTSDDVKDDTRRTKHVGIRLFGLRNLTFICGLGWVKPRTRQVSPSQNEPKMY